MAEEILKIQDLCTYFENDEGKVYKAVDKVSFNINKGEVFGMVGESGSGKSVCCRSIIHLVPSPGKIVSGKIIFEGTDITKASEEQMDKIRGKKIGMIFQEPMNTLNPVTTIGTQLIETMDRTKMTKEEKRERAIELLKMVEIPSPADRLSEYPHQFSGGMRQRAMIAIALAPMPELLIADEPTTALDVTIQAQIVNLLLSLREKLNMSLILITHDLGVASQMCDRIGVMYAGHIMEIARADDLMWDTYHPYTQGLLNSLPSNNSKGKKLTPIKGAPLDLSKYTGGCPFAPRCPNCQSKCELEFPEMRELSSGHFVRCHFPEKR